MIFFRRTTRIPSTRLHSVALTVFLSLVVTSPALAAKSHPLQHPLWPTQIRLLSAPLEDTEHASLAERVQVLHQLANYSTPSILASLRRALRDPAPKVHHAAFEICLQRRLSLCEEVAIERFAEPSLPSNIHLTALSVIAMSTQKEHIDLVFQALGHRKAAIRAQAALLLGGLVLLDEQYLQARQRLTIQLLDHSAQVRRSAALTLGHLGTDSDTYVLLRLLQDHDLYVRQAAVQSLGRIGDPRARAPLNRLLQQSSTEALSVQVLHALALIASPGSDRSSDDLDFEQHLLQYLKAPPPALSRSAVIHAFGFVRNPSPRLVHGLIAGLRHRTLRDVHLKALRELGHSALPALEEAQARGVEPSLQMELDLLQRALKIQVN